MMVDERGWGAYDSDELSSSFFELISALVLQTTVDTGHSGFLLTVTSRIERATVATEI